MKYKKTEIIKAALEEYAEYQINTTVKKNIKQSIKNKTYLTCPYKDSAIKNYKLHLQSFLKFEKNKDIQIELNILNHL